jgi:hypothetical protein
MRTTLGGINVWFLVQGKPEEERFSLPFQKSSSVRDAREQVKIRLGQPSLDYITLLFNGKALKDEFLLSRLRLGTTAITVYVKDTTEVVLTTVKAMRS